MKILSFIQINCHRFQGNFTETLWMQLCNFAIMMSFRYFINYGQRHFWSLTSDMNVSIMQTLKTSFLWILTLPAVQIITYQRKYSRYQIFLQTFTQNFKSFLQNVKLTLQTFTIKIFDTSGKCKSFCDLHWKSKSCAIEDFSYHLF